MNLLNEIKKILSSLAKHKAVIAIVLLSLVLRGGYLIAIGFDKDAVENVILYGDAKSYHLMASGFLEKGEFYRAGVLDTQRTPGYMLFLSLIYCVFGVNPIIGALANILLSLLTVPLLYMLIKRLSEEKTAIYGTLLYVLYPTAIFYSINLYSETLFVFFFILSLNILIQALDRANYRNFAFLGLSYGLLILVRPLGQYFFAISILSFLILSHEGLINKIKQTVLAVSIVFIVLSPWQIRNYQLFGRYSLSENSIYYSKLIEYIERYHGNSQENASNLSLKLIEDENPAPKNRFEIAEASKAALVKYILNDPQTFISYYIKTMSRNYFTIGSTNFLHSLGYINQMNAVDYRKINYANRFLEYLSEANKLQLSFFLVFFAYFMSVYILFCIGIIYILKNKNYKIAFIFLALIAVNTLVSGVLGDPRFNIPIMPLINVIAAYGMALMTSLFYRRNLKSIAR